MDSILVRGARTHNLKQIDVEDVMVVPEERLMYLKVNRKELDQAALAKLIPPPRP